MAFSIGVLSYTVSRLVSRVLTEPEVDLGQLDDLELIDETLPKQETLTFDEVKVARLFEHTPKSETDKNKESSIVNIDKTEANTSKMGVNATNIKVEKSKEKITIAQANDITVGDIDISRTSSDELTFDVEETSNAYGVGFYNDVYEDEVITKYFLKYRYDYRDMSDIKMRTDFVSKTAESKSNLNEDRLKNQQQEINRKSAEKTVMRKAEQNRFEEFKMQQKLAEKYTQQINSKD